MLSEVESADTLPFFKDASPKYEVNENDKIIAPSIAEVDSDPEKLREIRGQGRYFGIEDGEDGIVEPLPKCNNCSQRGHLKKNCPHVICSYCGVLDDHYSTHCPKTMRCSHCNEPGHYRQHCPVKWKRVFCTLCHSSRHSRDRCPSIWRSYCLKESSDKRVLPLHQIYCYNCGGKGHFGDDCLEARSSRVPNDDGSAFAGNNLPSSVRPDYNRNLKEYKVKTDYSYDDYDYNNYNFEEDDGGSHYYSSRYNNGESNGNKNKRSAVDYGDARPSNFYAPPYNKKNNRSNNSNGGNGNTARLPAPTVKGKVLPPKPTRSHPLDFPRNPNVNIPRYGSSSYQPSNDRYRNYNSYSGFKKRR